MNALDILITLLLLYGAYTGFKKGLVFEIAMIVGLIVGIYLALSIPFHFIDSLNPEILNTKH